MAVDNLNRTVDISDADLLKQALMGGTSKPTISADSKDQSQQSQKMVNLLKQLGADVEKSAKEAKRFYDAVSRSIKGGKPAGGLMGSLDKLFLPFMKGKGGGAGKDPSKDISTLLKLSTTKGSHHTHDSRAIAVLNAIQDEIVKMHGTLTGVVHTGGNTGGVGAGGGGATVAPAGQGPSGRQKIIGAISGEVVGLMGGMELWTNLFSGVLGKEIEYMQNMRRIAYQTEGITADTRDLQDAFQKTGKVVAQTGRSLSDFQKEYVTQIQKGTRSREQELKLTKTSLNLSTMIGSESSATADLFHDWHLTMGLTNNQMDDVSRGIQQVALQTGVVGQNLLNAVKSSEKFVKNLRNAGTLTAAAATSIIGLQTEFQKLGIADEMTEIMSAGTNAAELLLKTGKETQSIMFLAAGSAGKMQDLMEGTLFSTRGGKGSFAQGLKNIFKQFSGGFSVENMGAMSPAQLRNMNLALSALGINAGVLAKAIEGAEEQSKGLAEIQQDISKQLQNQNLTTQERLNLEQKLTRLQMTAGFQLLNAVDEAGKVAGTSMSDAVSKAMGKLGPEMEADLKAMGVSAADPMTKLQQVAQITATKLKEAGGVDLTSEVGKSISGGDMAGLREAISKMSVEQQKVGVDQLKKLDPITEVSQKIMEGNEILKNGFGKVIRTMFALLGPNGIMGLYLLASVTSSIASGGILGEMVKWFTKKGAASVGLVGAMAKGVKSGSVGAAPMMGRIWEKIKGGKKAAAAVGGAAEMGASGAQMALPFAGAVGGVGSKLGDVVAGGLTKLGGIMSKVGMAIKSGLGKGLSALKGIPWGTLAKYLAIGALGMIVLSTALVLVASAIFKIADVIMGGFGLTPGKVKEIASAVKTLLWSFVQIAIAVALGVGLLIGIGALLSLLTGPQALIAAGLLLLGIAAIAILTPVMVAVAATIVSLAQAVMGKIGIKPAEAKQVASDVASLMWSAAKIIMAVGMSIDALLEIGAAVLVALPFAPLASKIMDLGMYAIRQLVPSMIGFAAEIPKMAQGAMAGMDVEATKKVADDVGTLMWSAAKILAAVALGISVLMAAGIAVAALALSPIAAGILILGAAAMKLLLPAIVKFFASIVNEVAAITTGIDLNNVEVASKVLKASADMLKNLGEAMDVMGNKLVTFTEGTWWKLGLDSMAVKMLAAIPMITISVGALALFVKSVIWILQQAFPNNPKGVINDIEVAANVMKAIANTLTATADALQTMTNKLEPLVATIGNIKQGAKNIANLLIAIPQLKFMIATLANFMLNGVIAPLKAAFPNNPQGVTNDLNVAAAVMKAIASVIVSTADAFGALSGKLAPLTRETGMFVKDKSLADQLPQITQDVSVMIIRLAEFISGRKADGSISGSGIIPVLMRCFPNAGGSATRNIEVAANVMKSIAKMMEAMGSAFQSLGTSITPFFQKSWGLFKDGDSASKQFLDIKDDATNFLKSIGEFVSGGILKNLPEQGLMDEAVVRVELMAEMMGKLASAMDSVDKMSKPFWSRGWDFLTGKSLPVDQINKMITDVGKLNLPGMVRVAPTGGPTGATTSATSSTDTGSRVSQDRATGSPSAIRELGRVADASNKQISLLAQLHMDLIDISNKLTPQTSGASTRAEQKAPESPAVVPQWPQPQYGQASKGITSSTTV